MPLHKNFPKSPYEILDPLYRWIPDSDIDDDKISSLIPPLVPKIREEVKKWRDSDYKGASKTTKSLLNWWFTHMHSDSFENKTFEYYFCQREAVESVIYLFEIAKIQDKNDFLKFDNTGYVSSNMIAESWRRFVLKMATGSGKTKVISLLLAWSYFHKLYEHNSDLSNNFLIITPNIIVLDRIKTDFDNLKIFYEDPIIPRNGTDGNDWFDDFNLTVHIQDDIKTINKSGNIFLTNIHRIYNDDYVEPSADDDNTEAYYFGAIKTRKTLDSIVDLTEIVRDIDDLVIFNDEAHHLHDVTHAWNQSLLDIQNNLIQRGSKISLQIDTTATPKNEDGSIFTNTIVDYPLVEAIYQNIVKAPILPIDESLVALKEYKTSNFIEKYKEYIRLGYQEWKKVYIENKKLDKKSILFIMTDDTKNCDQVKNYLEETYSDLKNSVLVIHTKKNGEISDSSKNINELRALRQIANNIDSIDNPYKVIVSVLMLKEGWDVRNVTTIVGLRAFGGKNEILAEQTLGRGLRLMNIENSSEELSVIGTEKFMDFVKSIQDQGVVLEQRAVGPKTPALTSTIIEVDRDNKDITSLDIEIPILTPRIYIDYDKLSDLNPSEFKHQKFEINTDLKIEKTKNITFRYAVTKDQEDPIHHTTELEPAYLSYQGVISFFVHCIMKETRLFSHYDVLYEKIKYFILNQLFKKPDYFSINLDDPMIILNLQDTKITNEIISIFVKEINKKVVKDTYSPEIQENIKISNTRPFPVKKQPEISPEKSIFNKIVSESNSPGFELSFAQFLDSCNDVLSYTKIMSGIVKLGFKIDYVDEYGTIRTYIPDFIVKTNENIVIVETKGQEDPNVPLKMKRLKQWCDDLNNLQDLIRYDSMFVDQTTFEQYQSDFSNFSELEPIFTKYK